MSRPTTCGRGSRRAWRRSTGGCAGTAPKYIADGRRLQPRSRRRRTSVAGGAVPSRPRPRRRLQPAAVRPRPAARHVPVVQPARPPRLHLPVTGAGGPRHPRRRVPSWACGVDRRTRTRRRTGRSTPRSPSPSTAPPTTPPSGSTSISRRFRPKAELSVELESRPDGRHENSSWSTGKAGSTSGRAPAEPSPGPPPTSLAVNETMS